MPSPPRGLAPGALLDGKYRLLRPLGEGAMSAVWAARNEATTGEVALKIPHQVDPELRQRLQREARAGATLKHRNILEVHDIAQTDAGDPVLVMQLLQGESLFDLLARKRRLEAPEAARIARDIAAALTAAHAEGFIHRDLKPANVFLHQEPGSPAPVTKVLDFGVARALTGSDALQTAPGTLLGTPHYMSPEQARADAHLDHRTDLWSLGVVLFEMLTGLRPFPPPGAPGAPGTADRRPPSAGQVLIAVQQGEIPRVARLLRGADDVLDALVDRCLRRDPRERPATAADLVAELDAWLARAEAAAPAPRPAANVAPSGTLVLGPDAPRLTPAPVSAPGAAPVSAPGAAPVSAPASDSAPARGGTVRIVDPVRAVSAPDPEPIEPAPDTQRGAERARMQGRLRARFVALAIVTLLLLTGAGIAVALLRATPQSPAPVAATATLEPPEPPSPGPSAPALSVAPPAAPPEPPAAAIPSDPTHAPAPEAASAEPATTQTAAAPPPSPARTAPTRPSSARPPKKAPVSAPSTSEGGAFNPTEI